MNQSSEYYIHCPIHRQPLITYEVEEGNVKKQECNQCLVEKKLKVDDLVSSFILYKQKRVNIFIEYKTQILKIIVQIKGFLLTNQSISGQLDKLSIRINKIIDSQIEKLNFQITNSKLDTIYQQLKSHPKVEGKFIFQKFIKEILTIINPIPTLQQFIQGSLDALEDNLISVKYELKYQIDDMKDCQAITMIEQQKILVIGNQKEIQVFDIESRAIKTTFTGHQDDILCLCYCQKNCLLISGSKDNCIIIWEIRRNNDWRQKQILQGHEGSVLNIIPNKEETQIISYSSDKTIRVWMLDDNKIWNWKQTIKDITSNVFTLSLRFDGRHLVSCGLDSLRVWKKVKNYDKWSEKQVVNNPQGQSGSDFSFKKACFVDKELIAMCQDEGTLFRLRKNDYKQYEIQEKKTLVLNENRNFIKVMENQIVICPHGRMRCYMLAIKTNRDFANIQEFSGNFCGQYLSKDGRNLILADNTSRKVQIWEIEKVSI